MRLQVVYYSGRKEDERPTRFQLGDHEYFVEEVVDHWYPNYTRLSGQWLRHVPRHKHWEPAGVFPIAGP